MRSISMDEIEEVQARQAMQEMVHESDDFTYATIGRARDGGVVLVLLKAPAEVTSTKLVRGKKWETTIEYVEGFVLDEGEYEFRLRLLDGKEVAGVHFICRRRVAG